MWQLHPLPSTVLILILMLTLGTAQSSNGVDNLKLPALGRTASLGDLYDERTDQFRSSVFKADVPPAFTKLTDKPYTFTETAITNTIAQKFSLLKLGASIQASVLSGLFTVSGSASYLNQDKTSSHEVLGNLLLKYQTAVEQLHLFYDGIRPYYKTELLTHEGATHIVSSITWGANVAVSFKDSNSNKDTEENVSGKLSVEFKKIQGFLDIGASADVNAGQTGNNSISTYSMSVHGDVKLPNEIPTNYQQIKELLAKIPGSIRETNGGKGVPLEYTLTPIAQVNEKMQITEAASESQFAHQLDESILISCIDIFEEISKIQQIFYDLNSEFDSYPACVAPQTMDLFKTLKHNFTTSKLHFTAAFKDTLIKVRSGLLTSSALAQLAAGVDLNLSENTINSQISDFFDEARVKIFLCGVFANAHNNHGTLSPIEYFGSRRTFLNERIQENRVKPVYILFQKYEHIQMYPDEWNDNLNTFLYTLNRPYNKLFVVDCDFECSYCRNVSKPVIRQFKNGRIAIADVTAELQNSNLFSKVRALKIEALGRFAQIGELYDARTDTFLKHGVSILPHNYPDSLVRLTADVDSTAPEIKDVYSERLTDKIQALKINSKDQQFSILAGLLPLNGRTAQYLKLGGNEGDHVRMHSMVRTLVLNEDHISDVNGPKFEEVIQPNVLDTVEATHFVFKRTLGFTSVFSIEDCSSPINGNATYENTSSSSSHISDLFNQMKSMIVVSQPTQKQQSASAHAQNSTSLEGNFKIKIYSDTQRENSEPINFETSADFLNYLNTQFYQQQVTQNGGKGQPVSYELYPIQNLASDLGILAPKILYKSLSSATEDPAAYSNLLEQVQTGKIQIQKVEDEMKRNPDCTTDHDLSDLAAVKLTFENTMGQFASNFSDIVTKIKTGELELDSLQNFRTEYEAHNYFGHGSEYKGLERLSVYMGKLSLVKRLQNSNSRIKYIGREIEDISFNTIFENEDASQTFVLFYKPEWASGEGAEADEWRRLSYNFFGAAGADVRRFIVDCNFKYTYCHGMHLPAIYKTSRGRLVPYNSTSYGPGDDVTGDDIFSDSRGNSLNETIQTAIIKVTDQIRDLRHSYVSLRDIVNNISSISHTHRNSICSLQNGGENCGLGNIRPSDIKPMTCGGTIPMERTGASVVYGYKTDSAYSNNENCLWTLDTHDSHFYRKKQQLRITLVSHGFSESADGLMALKFNRGSGTELTSERLQQGTPHTFHEDALFLSFTSDGSGTGTGFLIRIEVLTTEDNANSTHGTCVHRTSTPDSITFGAYKDNDLITVVVNPVPSRHLTFRVDNTSTEDSESCRYDRLIIWTIGRLGSFEQKDMLCGVHSSSPVSFSTNELILTLFTSDGSTTGNGFKISWQ